MKAEGIIGVALLVLSPLFFIGGPEYDAARSYKAFWNIGHIVFFTLAARFILVLWPLQKLWKQALLVLLFAAVVGVLIELLQYTFSRSPDVLDLLRNEIGAAIGLLWYRKEWFRSWRYFAGTKAAGAIAVGALLGLMWSLGQLLIVLFDEYRMQRGFPVLADFESPVELSRWSGEAVFELSGDHVAHGQSALKIHLGDPVTPAPKYSGVRLDYLICDWRDYEGLNIDIYSAAEKPFDITLRIHDKTHRLGDQPHNDRFNRRFNLVPGWNHLLVPLNEVKQSPVTRSMDMSAVESIGLFIVNRGDEKIIYLDNVRLNPFVAR